MWFELEGSLTQRQGRRSYTSVPRQMYKHPLPEAWAFERRLHVQEILEYSQVLYSFFARKNSGDHNEGIVYVSVLLLNPNSDINPYPTAFPYGNGMVLHFYQQQESSTTKTVHKVINKGLKTYV